MGANQLKFDIGETRSSRMPPDDFERPYRSLALTGTAQKQKKSRGKSPDTKKPAAFLPRKRS